MITLRGLKQYATVICYWSFSFHYGSSFSHKCGQFLEEASLLKFKCPHFCVFNKTNINTFMYNINNVCYKKVFLYINFDLLKLLYGAL